LDSSPFLLASPKGSYSIFTLIKDPMLLDRCTPVIEFYHFLLKSDTHKHPMALNGRLLCSSLGKKMPNDNDINAS
jgi:hypothetical protein